MATLLAALGCLVSQPAAGGRVRVWVAAFCPLPPQPLPPLGLVPPRPLATPFAARSQRLLVLHVRLDEEDLKLPGKLVQKQVVEEVIMLVTSRTQAQHLRRSFDGFCLPLRGGD